MPYCHDRHPEFFFLRELVPNGSAFAICIISAFYLVDRSGNAPLKIGFECSPVPLHVNQPVVLECAQDFFLLTILRNEWNR